MDKGRALKMLAVFFLTLLGYSIYAQEKVGSVAASEKTMPIGKVIQQADWFEGEKSFLYNKTGELYEIGRIVRSNSQYGPLTLRIKNGDEVRIVTAPHSEDLEIYDIQLHFINEHPYFLVIDRYKLFLVDMENESIAPFMQPGLAVEYREDAMSGTMNGFQFFNRGNYLLGIAVNYGVFCFDLTDTGQPAELQRYSSQSSDYGQPYFFLQQQSDGTWNGIIAQSDTLKKSRSVTGFYTESKTARFIFQDERLIEPTDPVIDPYFEPKPYLMLRAIKSDGAEEPWGIDLQNGILHQGKEATDYLEEQSKSLSKPK